MRLSPLTISLALITQALPSFAVSNLKKRLVHKRSTGVKLQSHPDPDILGNATFKQIIDHKDPGKGTFEQRYWWDAQWWKGPGSPIFLFTPGETDAGNMLGYLSNTTIPGLYAQLFEAAVVILEHRYWGDSIPFEKLTTETLQHLNLPNNMHDLTNFARNVELEFDDSDGGANADNAPWVLIGGSYAGALAAWTQQKAPGTFWAYHASSAVVQAIYDYHDYFVPIERALPRNCSADIAAVVWHVDEVLARGDVREVAELKALFGLEQLDHDDDFAVQIATPLWQWQSNSSRVLEFCDHLEAGDGGGGGSGGGSDSDIDEESGSEASGSGVGLDAALQAYASWINGTAGETCRDYDCDTYDAPGSWDVPDDLDGDRQWDWMLCNEPLAFWQTGSRAAGDKALVSSANTAEHWQRLCPLKFPRTGAFEDGSTTGFLPEHENMYTGGWSADFERVLFCNGEIDPWITAGVSSEFRPGGPLESTDDHPVFTVKNGNHVPDLVVDDIKEEIDVVNGEIQAMKRWLKEYYDGKKKKGDSR